MPKSLRVQGLSARDSQGRGKCCKITIQCDKCEMKCGPRARPHPESTNNILEIWLNKCGSFQHLLRKDQTVLFS